VKGIYEEQPGERMGGIAFMETVGVGVYVGMQGYRGMMMMTMGIIGGC
jgi:hypothetical protein